MVLPVPRTRWHALADLTGDLDIRRLLALLRDDEPPIDVLEQVLRRIDETLS